MEVNPFKNRNYRHTGKIIDLLKKKQTKKELVDIKRNYQAVGLTQSKETIFQTVIS